MEKSHIATIGVIGLLVSAYAGYVAYEHSQLPKRWKDLTPLDTPLIDQGNSRFSVQFEAGHSELHYLGIAFPRNPGIQETESAIAIWNGIQVASKGTPEGPDLQWKLLEGDHLISQGTGNQVEGWIGHSIVIGHIKLKSNHRYNLVTTIGPQFKKFLACNPRIEIGVETATVSIGLAIDRDFGRPYSIGVATVGGILLLIAAGNIFATIRKQRSTKIRG